MDSGKQKSMNRDKIFFIENLQKQILEIFFGINNINDRINKRRNNKSYESLKELLRIRKMIKKSILYRINIIEKVKDSLIIC